jgi:CubicO group peptidase (beta-lactamase class C family)
VSPLWRRGYGGMGDSRPIPAHPYRDAALVYAAMAVVLVIVATATGGEALRALLAALIFFTLATGWSWWRFRARIKARDAAAEAASSSGGSGTAGTSGTSGTDSGARANGSGNGNDNSNGRGGTE